MGWKAHVVQMKEKVNKGDKVVRVSWRERGTQVPCCSWDEYVEKHTYQPGIELGARSEFVQSARELHWRKVDGIECWRHLINVAGKISRHVFDFHEGVAESIHKNRI